MANYALTSEEVQAIREFRAAHPQMTFKEIGKRFQRPTNTVRRIIKGEAWKKAPGPIEPEAE